MTDETRCFVMTVF